MVFESHQKYAESAISYLSFYNTRIFFLLIFAAEVMAEKNRHRPQRAGYMMPMVGAQGIPSRPATFAGMALEDLQPGDP